MEELWVLWQVRTFACYWAARTESCLKDSFIPLQKQEPGISVSLSDKGHVCNLIQVFSKVTPWPQVLWKRQRKLSSGWGLFVCQAFLPRHSETSLSLFFPLPLPRHILVFDHGMLAWACGRKQRNIGWLLKSREHMNKCMGHLQTAIQLWYCLEGSGCHLQSNCNSGRKNRRTLCCH